MRVVRSDAEGFAAEFDAFCESRADYLLATGANVDEILAGVRARGDDALIEFTEKFEHRTLTRETIEVPREAWAAALARLSPELVAALKLAIARVEAFHKHQIEHGFSFVDEVAGEGEPGSIRMGQRVTPMQRVGLYVPGGTAAYPSSLIMNAVPARVAGVEEIVMVSPVPRMPGETESATTIPDVILGAALLCGVSRVFQIGGAQAVAALAFGTETVPRVDKIVGPGNIWVAAAKRAVYGRVDIDMVAGPSEVCVVADGHAEASWVAGDLLAQAEHDALAGVLLLTPDAALAEAVRGEVARQLDGLPRRAVAEKSVARGLIVVTRDVADAIALANQYAPEHLELALVDAADWFSHVRNAGCVFLGEYTPEALGDYLAGANHVLPTSGSARFFAPLGVYDFMTRTSFVQCGRDALRVLAPSIKVLADSEGLKAHRDAVLRRFASEGDGR